MSWDHTSRIHPDTDKHSWSTPPRPPPSYPISGQFNNQQMQGLDSPPTTPPLVPGNTYSPPLSPRSMLLGSPMQNSNNIGYPGKAYNWQTECAVDPGDHSGIGSIDTTPVVLCNSPTERYGPLGYNNNFNSEKQVVDGTFGQQAYDRDPRTSSYDRSARTSFSGRKKALCIGINYRDPNIRLNGCINDVRNVAEFLTVQFGYKKEDIRQLTDDTTDYHFLPTRENIIAAMHWLVEDARPTDTLFFHFSGHGGQIKDLDGDEADGFDEIIYPLDFMEAGHILDDEMHEIMVQPLRAGCRLTAIFDCSHSGSALDLPYTYSTDGKLKEHSQLVETGRGLMNVGKLCARGDVSNAFRGLGNVIRPPTSRRARKKAAQYARETRHSEADVISWSACKDSEKSDDAFENQEAVGAMSYAFIQSLTRKPRQSYRELLIDVRTILRSRYQQKPQLSSSHIIDTNNWFVA